VDGVTQNVINKKFFFFSTTYSVHVFLSRP